MQDMTVLERAKSRNFRDREFAPLPLLRNAPAVTYTETMMIRALALLLGVSIAFVGCAARESRRPSAPQFVKMQTVFDYSEHEPYAKPGSNGIHGITVLSRQGGDAATCAGSRVLLMPATSYFREMFWHMIVAGSEPEPPQNPHPQLKPMIRRTVCDAQGSFSFSEIADGTWFLLTQVNVENGSLLIAEVTLQNSGTTEVLLTDKHIVNR